MRIVPINGNLQSANAHLRYLQREGTQRDGSAGRVYSASEDSYEGKSFIARCIDDRHQFRLVVSPEDGDCYEELKPLVRCFMGELERDLDTSLQWAAVDHSDTAHPHAHIILRGRDELGEDLIIAREYVRYGMHARLIELVTRDLGPREPFEPRQTLRQEVEAERLTSIDRALLHSIDEEHTLEPGRSDPFQHALRVGRLRKLERLGFAQRLNHGRWRLPPEAEQQLSRLGERNCVTRTIERELHAHGLDRPRSEWVVWEPSTNEVIGQIIAHGAYHEHAGRHFLLVDGVDGRIHHVAIGPSDFDQLPERSIVRLRTSGGGLGFEDHEVAEQSGSRGPQLESWCSGRVEITILSPIALKDLPSWNGPTWLDRQLAGLEAANLRDSGFGAEVRSALAARGRWLLDEELATEDDGVLEYRPDAPETLRNRELHSIAGRLRAEVGKDFVVPEEGLFVSGALKRRIDLASGRFALLENSREFTLLPWQSDLERAIGREVGCAIGEGLSWASDRNRGPSIA